MDLPKKLVVCVAGMGLTAQAANAQSSSDYPLHTERETRASVSFTIPLGSKRDSDAAKPRLELTLDNRNWDSSYAVAPLRVDANRYAQPDLRTKVSFTLEQNPKLLMNDQRVATFGPRLTADEEESGGGLGTAGWIVLGAGALVGTSFLFADFLKDDIEDAVRGED